VAGTGPAAGTAGALPRASTVMAAIVVATLRAWYTDLARSFGSRAVARGVVAAAGLLLLGWLVGGSLQLSESLDLRGAEQATILAPAAAAVLLALPALSTVLAAIYAPSRTALDNILVLLPVSEQRRRAVVRWFATVLGLLLGGVWALPLGLQVLVASPGRAVPLVALCVVWLMVCGAVAAQLVVDLVERLLEIVVGPDSTIARAMAGVIAALGIAGGFLAAIPGPSEPEGAGPVAWLGLRFQDVVALRAPVVGVAVLGGLVATLLGVSALANRAPRGYLHDRTPLRLPAGLPLSRRGWASAVQLEVLQWLRYPTNATLLMFTSSFTLIAVLAWGRGGTSGTWLTISLLLFALVSTVGVGAYGATREHHWLYRTTRRPYAWMWPKLAGSAVVWAALLLLIGTVLSAFTAWRPADGLFLVPVLTVEFLAGCLIGLVVPANREQSLSASLAESLAVLGCMSVTVAVYSLPFATSSHAGYGLTCATLTVLLLAAYVVIGRHRDQEIPGAG